MKTLHVIIILALFLLSFIAGLLSNSAITGQTIQETNEIKTYSHTKAICNENNECIDILIECENEKLLSIKPISDLIKYNKNWKDNRTNANDFCNQ
jgi:hypothetical protein